MFGSAGVVAGNLIGLDRRGTASLEGSLTGSNFPTYQPPRLPTSVYSGILAGVDTVIGGRVAAAANVISGFPRGVFLYADSDIVSQDLIGTNAAGTAAIPNGDGVQGNEGPAGAVGSVLDSVISGNSLDGVFDVREVAGSRIGTNADGTAALANGGWGVTNTTLVGGVRAAGSQSCVSPCNLISGNGLGGVQESRKVEGNFIGTDLTGTASIANGGYWNSAAGRRRLATEEPYPFSSAVSEINGLGGPSRAMSGVCDQACNLISGNDRPGVQLIGGIEPTMQGNVIGRSATGAPLPNRSDGVLVTQADKIAVIGGDGDAGNLIADNTGAAIKLPLGGIAPTIEGNSITGNANGVVYAPGTVAPVAPSMLPLTRGAGGVVSLSGNLPSFLAETAHSQTPARVDVYASPACGSQRQGKVPLGTATVLLTGHWTFTASGVAPSLPDFMTTVTIDGSTSVYSACAS